MRMTAGFLIMDDYVLLVEKAKPDWQAGLWNAVGGKMETGETSHDCMVREFREETGLDVPHWDELVTEVVPTVYAVHFFRAFVKGTTMPPVPQRNDVGEELRWVSHGQVHSGAFPVVGNLRWLIPMAMDWRSVREGRVVFNDDIKKKARW